METVLLVEDSPAVRNVVRQILERLGYVVLEASSAPDALAAVERHCGRIDLLLTDVMMPQGDCGQLVREVRGLRPEIGVLYTSGYTENVLDSIGDGRSARHFIQKPFTSEALGRAIRQALGGAGRRAHGGAAV